MYFCFLNYRSFDFIKKRYIAAAISIGTIFSAATPAPATAPIQPLRNNCAKLYSQTEFRHVAHKVYRSYTRVSRHESQTLRRLIRCQHSDNAEKNVRRWLRGYQRGHRSIVLWHYYKTHPMPRCTWESESGTIKASGPEWPPSPVRYTKPNDSGSAASGKYQIMDSTWIANGGTRRGNGWHSAAKSPPIEQEKIARRLYASQGTSPWSAC